MCLNAISGLLGSIDGANSIAKTQQQENQFDEAMLMQQQQQSAAATAQADAAEQAAANTTAQDQGIVSNDFSQFNPAFYQNYQNAYTNYYDPQLANQYAQAKDQLTAALSQNGTLESTVGANALAQLAAQDASQNAAITQQAQAAANTLQQQVSQDQTSLDQQANAATNPSQVASAAQAATTALAAPQTFTPLSNAFTSLVTPTQGLAQTAANAATGNSGAAVLPQTTTPNAYSGSGNAGSTSSPY